MTTDCLADGGATDEPCIADLFFKSREGDSFKFFHANQLAHTRLAQHGVAPGRVVEADQDAVIASLVASGVGMALMREEVAIEQAATGEVCMWSDAKIDTTRWFITQRAREHDRVVHALNAMQRERWAVSSDPDRVCSEVLYRGLNPASRDNGSAQSSPRRT